MSAYRLQQMARDAGFRRAGEITSSSTDSLHGKVFGMDIVTSPLMPKDFFALRTERGAMVCGPKGYYWVPFWPSFPPPPPPPQGADTSAPVTLEELK